jgi:error-prone DNA polymerase
MEYAELHCISSFSFLRGASHPHELVRRAHDLGYAAIAITDECTMAGMVRAHVAARDAEMHLIAGSEFVLDAGERVVLLATNLSGYGNLCELITMGRSRAPKGEYSLSRADFRGSLDECLLLVIPDDNTTVDDIRWWQSQFSGRCWIAVELLHGPDDTAWLAKLREYSQCTGVPLVAAGGVHMHVAERKSLQDVMTAIRLGKTVEELGWDALPNAERHLRERRALARKYPGGLLAESVRIAALCRFSMSALRYRYPLEFLPPSETTASYLGKLVHRGALIRYPQGVPDKVGNLLKKELALIIEKEFESFFLTVYEIVEFAKSKNILCQGRGSAANSAVCFCLGITEVDPDQTEVLFERFISKERTKNPTLTSTSSMNAGKRSSNSSMPVMAVTARH